MDDDDDEGVDGGHGHGGGGCGSQMLANGEHGRRDTSLSADTYGTWEMFIGLVSYL